MLIQCCNKMSIITRHTGVYSVWISLRRIHVVNIKPFKIMHLQKSRMHVSFKYEQKSKNAISNFIEKTRVLLSEPFIKISLMALAAVMAATALYEYLYRGPANKKSKSGIKILPPAPNHYCIERSKYMSLLEEICTSGLPFFKNIKTVFLTGPSASGKSQIMRMYAEKYSNKFRLPIFSTPVIATLNGNSIESYLLSMRSLAIELGSTPMQWSQSCDSGVSFSSLPVDRQIDILVEEVSKKLKACNGWLLIIDNLNANFGIKETWWPQPNGTKEWGRGCVLIVSEDALQPNVIERRYKASEIIHVEKRLTESEATSLYNHISGNQGSLDGSLVSFLKELEYSPLAVSLASSYIKSKNDMIPIENSKLMYNCDNFVKDLKAAKENFKQHCKADCVEDGKSTVDAIIASICVQHFCQYDPQFQSSCDLLGALPPGTPIPVNLLKGYLHDNGMEVLPIKPLPKSTSHASASDNSAVPLETRNFKSENKDMQVQSENIGDSSFFQVLLAETRKIFNSIFSDSHESDANVNSAESSNIVGRISKNVLLSGETHRKGNVELVTVHPIVHSAMRSWFFLSTIPILEKLHLVEQEVKGKSSWFGQIKNFDEKSCLERYRSELCSQFDLKYETSSKVEQNGIYDKTNETSIKYPLENANRTPSSYVRAQKYALLRRIGKSLIAVSKNRRSEFTYCVTSRYLLPHVSYLMNSLKEVDLKFYSELLDTTAVIYSDILNDDSQSIELLRRSLTVKRDVFGDMHYQTARTLMLLGVVLNGINDVGRSKSHLEEAVKIFDSLPLKKKPIPKQVRDHATALSALGVVCSNLHENDRSQQLLERALSLMQTVQPEDPTGMANDQIFSHASDVATMLTDIGHVYLLNGETNFGHRLLNFALNIHQNIHGEEHREVVRTLTVLSVAQMMQGFYEDSKKSRDRAGAIRANLNASIAV